MMIGSASMIDGLYNLDDNSFCNKQAQGLSGSTSSISVHEQVMLWHRRQGHPSFSYLNHLFPSLFKNLDCNSFTSDICHLSKSHQVLYKSKPYLALKPFYLIQ